MYPPHVVRRDFKAGGELYEAGTIVEDITVIPLFKTRISDNLLVALPENEVKLEELCYFLEVRYGIDLRQVLADRASKGSKIAEPAMPVASAPTPPGTNVVQVTPAPKVTV